MSKTNLFMIIAALLIIIGLGAFTIAGNYLPGNILNNPSGNFGVGGGPPEDLLPTQLTSSPAVSSPAEYQASVSYTGDMFTPEVVTVRAGESVQWINESEASMWIASTPHPTHDDYPGFDQLYGVGESQRYSFTFDNPGVWYYHNHLNPAQTGRVIVI